MIVTLCRLMFSSMSAQADSTTARSLNMKSLIVMSCFTRRSMPYSPRWRSPEK
jgi:hypothetical protein